MSDKQRTALWQERKRLERARREEVARAMKYYDETVHWPAMQSIRERCAALGHYPNKLQLHDNGLGWTWFNCNVCGNRLELRGPDGKLYDLTAKEDEE